MGLVCWQWPSIPHASLVKMRAKDKAVGLQDIERNLRTESIEQYLVGMRQFKILLILNQFTFITCHKNMRIIPESND